MSRKPSIGSRFLSYQRVVDAPKVIEWEVQCGGILRDGTGCARFKLIKATVDQMTGKNSPKWRCHAHKSN